MDRKLSHDRATAALLAAAMAHGSIPLEDTGVVNSGYGVNSPLHSLVRVRSCLQVCSPAGRAALSGLAACYFLSALQHCASS